MCAMFQKKQKNPFKTTPKTRDFCPFSYSSLWSEAKIYAYPNLGVAPNRLFHINLDLLVGCPAKSDPKHIRIQMLVNDGDFSSHGIPIRPQKITNKSKLIFTLQITKEYYDIFTIKINHLWQITILPKPEFFGDFCCGDSLWLKTVQLRWKIGCELPAGAPQRVITRLMYCNIHIVVFLCKSAKNKKKKKNGV